MKDIFVVGAQKAGSTFLHNLLAENDFLAEPPVKEPHFFSSSLWPGQAWPSLFAHADASMRLDSSVSYLHIPSSASRIHADRGEGAYVFAVVRDPVERAVSAYFHSLKHGREVRRAKDVFAVSGTTYEQIRQEEEVRLEAAFARGACIMRETSATQHSDRVYHDPSFNYRYIANSFYADQLAPYLSMFPNLKVIDFKFLVRNPEVVVSRISDLLGRPLAPPARGGQDKNSTRVDRQIVMKRQYRNLSRASGHLRGGLTLLRNMPAILQLEFDARKIVRDVEAAPWAAPARASYEALLASNHML
ncbi:sulfotransferase domain-containing protein [Novosphingobium mangrovi (ex Hu et al. 2023)]|uniref:Sulfotransferase domain-containing protein n=1 Tax=Novosphingobium mangrovi (ex Hu et al. 2023) TaxID=2930094 RepID=A0ABT0AC95_9SPHN|nr:sulfotransferase domain-containing protein [Novosphingobium mangrovi (ex Hu et al. 2023)]MCJ1960820.1 sulfotransferase domain-containing protein [Novosphingobium mangrovi (ex Hu et al. 2023)]